MITFAIIIFWLGFLILPLLAFMLWRWKKGKEKTWQVIPFAILLVFLFYARFIEAQTILVQERVIETELEHTIRVAVFADPHLGVYKGERFLARVVEKVNAKNPDIVMIPGDFVFAMPEDRLEAILDPLKELKAPAFAVLGNHDFDENLEDEIQEILKGFGIEFLEDKVIPWETPTGEVIQLTGSKDFWQYKANEIEPLDINAEGFRRPSFFTHSPIIQKPERIQPEDIVIWLAHNPDTSHYLDPVWDIDLLFSGHTHGGQIWIPGISKRLIPTKHTFVQGWYKIGVTDVFVTAGVGETGLPLRLGVYPTIDIIELR